MNCGGQAATFRSTVFIHFCSFRRAHNLSRLKKHVKPKHINARSSRAGAETLWQYDV